MGHCNILARAEEGRKASGKKTSGVEENGKWEAGGEDGAVKSEY